MLVNQVNNLTTKDISQKTINLKTFLKACSNESILQDEEAADIHPDATIAKRGCSIEIDCPTDLERKADED